MSVTAKHGKNNSVKVDNAAGTLTDISNQCTSVDFAEDAELAETTAFQDAAKTFVVGFKDSKISLQGNWSAALDTHLGTILGQEASVSFELGPEGTGSGKIKYTGEAFLTSFKKTGAVKGVNGFTAELQVSGAVTRSTFA
jgi:hypothetical protein